MKIISRFVVTVGSDSGLAVFVDDAGGVYITRSDELLVQGDPDYTLESYKQGLAKARKRNPLLAVLNAVPLEELNNRVVHFAARNAKVVFILDDEGREVRRIDA